MGSGDSYLDRVRSRRWSASLPDFDIPVRDPEVRLTVLAIATGIVAGLGAVLFRLTIWLAQEFFYGASLNPGNVEFELVAVPDVFRVLSFLGGWRFVFVPAVGGLIVGLIIRATTSEVKGHGVPKVMESMLVRGGRIDPRIALYKTLASSIAIGSGGSLGREGPIVQIGSAAGSSLGRFLDQKYTRTLVAAGAAGGIAGTFNAPLAGVMFALEILLAEYYLTNVTAVVVSAVAATAVARQLLAFTPNPGVEAFLVPIHYRLLSPAVEYPLYALLGFLLAVAGALFVKSLYGTEHLFERLDAPEYVKPAVGGLLLGLSVLFTAVLFPATQMQSAQWLLGVGYNVIRTSIQGNLTLVVLLALAVMKTIGFSLSVGSGSSGGVFSPSLYVGAMLGGAFGASFAAVVPGTAGPGAYALVGMGGAFAASARAPLTATLIIFELTGQYTIILPLLIVCVIASIGTQRLLNRGTIYTEKLRDRGITVQERRIGSLEDLCATDVMSTDIDTISVDATAEDAIRLFEATKHHALPIVDENDVLVGIVTLTDLENELAYTVIHAVEGDREIELEQEANLPIEDVGQTDVLTADSGINLLALVDRMAAADVGRVPIVDENDVLIGIVTRSDILGAYDDVPIFS